MKFSSQLVISSLAVVVLSACSSSPAERRQARDDFDYLDTPSFESWQMLPDAKEVTYPNYSIPAGSYNGPIGNAVDIRPPQQILELIPGARVEEKDSEVTMWLLRKEEQDKVWATVQQMIQDRGIKLVENGSDYIGTDWIKWVSDDEENVIESRYAIEKFEANNRYGFKVSLIDWRENGRALPVSRTNRERYNIFMTNLITSSYDQKLREEAQLKAEKLVKQIPVSMGKDRSGLPIIVARAPYRVFWQRMTRILPQMGFNIEERSQSQGLIKTKYGAPDDEFWQSIGIEPVEIEGLDYDILLGDLGNRTSINITAYSGKPVSEELLQKLVPVIEAIIKKDSE
ncbi:outer membrane protein assembly factor BamC [Vibrio sp. SCSIO 43137]|uniref:outer membrane protein assembly factor BamC n=1 Tax=Vibrio sp. SCSIO 43137 TaxID=3021011 RepID=UPI0023079007|nr:outer membrane protein assembly factor BamC [Vibrio sp. SCSIO 43137]WCE30475.1 outer membrane protein assembly factor BamC [Vibrio sp. SCSIO 43137]